MRTLRSQRHTRYAPRSCACATRARARSRCPRPRGPYTPATRAALESVWSLKNLEREVERTGGGRARSSRGVGGRRRPRQLICDVREWHALTGGGGSRGRGATCGSERAGSRRQHGRRAQGVREWDRRARVVGSPRLKPAASKMVSCGSYAVRLRSTLALLPAACDFASVRAQAQRRSVCGSQVNACQVGISPQPKPHARKTRSCTCGGSSGVIPPLTMLCARNQQKRM